MATGDPLMTNLARCSYDDCDTTEGWTSQNVPKDVGTGNVKRCVRSNVHWIRIKNAGKVKTPQVEEVKIYSDEACTRQIPIKNYNNAQYSAPAAGDPEFVNALGFAGANAWDNQDGSKPMELNGDTVFDKVWRPKCTNGDDGACKVGSAWISLRFPFGETARCVQVIDAAGAKESFSQGGLLVEEAQKAWGTNPVEADWRPISLNTPSQGRAQLPSLAPHKTAIICSQAEGMCVSREGSNNYCYGSSTGCQVMTFNGRQCVTNSDCERFNTAGAPRWTATATNNCGTTTDPWAKELCAMNEARLHCDNDNGCELFKQTLKLSDLPHGLKTAAFRGPRYEGVTGDLQDLVPLTQLTTLAFPASPKVTGDIAKLSTCTALTHLDFGGSPLLRGDVTGIKTLPLTYINLHSAPRIGGPLSDLPAALVFGNFNAALRFKGSVNAIITGGVCNLKELDLGSAVGTGIGGSLSDAAGGTTGLFERCTGLKYVDLGSVYGSCTGAPTTCVQKGNYVFKNSECVKANGLATKGCQ